MANRFRLYGLALAGLFTAAPVFGDTQFTARRMTRNDVPLGQGQCDIRLQVDGEVEVSLRGDRVHIRTISGRDARDDGSECNEPMPMRDVQGFHFDVRDSRGEIALLSEPDRRNGFAAIVRIRDSKGGEGRYHFRVAWQMTGGGGGFRGGPPPPPTPDFGRERGGFGRGPSDVRFVGRGDGSYQRGGFRAVRLGEARVDVERGRARIGFQADDGRPLTFSGNVVRVDGDTYVCDVTGGDMRGTMFISVDRSGNVFRVNMDGEAGRDRFRLQWRR